MAGKQPRNVLLFFPPVPNGQCANTLLLKFRSTQEVEAYGELAWTDPSGWRLEGGESAGEGEGELFAGTHSNHWASGETRYRQIILANLMSVYLYQADWKRNRLCCS